jgi:hypothetical protein
MSAEGGGVVGPYYKGPHKTFYGNQNIINAFANYRHICPKIDDIVPDTFRTTIEDQLKQVCINENMKFSDPEFPPTMESLVDPTSQIKGEYDRNWVNFEWGRVSDIFGTQFFKVFQDIDPCDVRQGELGNCYFLSCLSALAEYPYLITRLFDTDVQDDQGVYAVWLHINGTWREIIIDDFYPIIDLGEGIEFAFSRTSEDELWAMALEKAYAKAYGSYHRIEVGDPVYTLRELTGAPFERIEDAAFKNFEFIWNKIVTAERKGYVMIAYTKNTMVRDAGGNTSGLVSGQCYSVLQGKDVTDSYGRYARIVQIRNPWGAFEWKGDWSYASNLWTPELRTQLGVTNGEDGLHWMSLESFLSHFEGLGVAEVEIGNLHNSLQIKTSQKNEKTIVKFVIDQDGEYTFAIDQTDSRFYDESQGYSYSYFRVTIGHLTVNKIEYFDCIYSSERSIFVGGSLPKGNYIALVEVYWYSFERNYTFSVYGPGRSALKQLARNNIDFEKCEYLIWKDFSMRQANVFAHMAHYELGDGYYAGTLAKANYQNEHYGLSINRWTLQGQARGVKRGFRANNLVGFEIVSEYNHGDEHYMFINPDMAEVEIFKMDPRSPNGFRVDEEGIDLELMDTDIPDDRAIIDRINSVNVIIPQYAYQRNPNIGNNNLQMRGAAFTANAVQQQFRPPNSLNPALQPQQMQYMVQQTQVVPQYAQPVNPVAGLSNSQIRAGGPSPLQSSGLLADPRSRSVSPLQRRG